MLQELHILLHGVQECQEVFEAPIDAGTKSRLIFTFATNQLKPLVEELGLRLDSACPDDPRSPEDLQQLMDDLVLLKDRAEAVVGPLTCDLDHEGDDYGEALPD